MLSVAPARLFPILNSGSLCALSQAAKSCSNKFLIPLDAVQPAANRGRGRRDVVVVRSIRDKFADELQTTSDWSSGSRAPIHEVSDLRRGIIPIHNVSMADIEAAEEVKRVGAGGGRKAAARVELGGFSIEGISIGGQETCVMVPGMRWAFDIGRCPQRAISQDFLFISHAHMDHIGGIAMYVATRGLYRMKPPTVFVPKCIKATVEKLIDVYRELDGSELALQLVGLDIGEEYDMGKGYVVKPFRTYHGVPSQGYVIYSVKKKLKLEYRHLPGPEIKRLKFAGVEIVDTIKIPEVAFTGDTTADFIVDEANKDALEAKLLIMEATFVNEAISVEHARDYGHVHLSEVAALADKFKNRNILFIHFSARYEAEEITRAIDNLPEAFKGRVAPLLEGF